MDSDGFFSIEHPVKAPVSTLREGIWVSGCARGPCDISEAVSQGQAAAGLMLSRLVPGKHLRLPACVSQINPDACSGCRICLNICPFGAIVPVASHAAIQEALCRGCGTCAAVCPSNAIDAKQFSDKEISEEIKGLLLHV
jgi:heterodisulfide reductase subunit A